MSVLAAACLASPAWAQSAGTGAEAAGDGSGSRLVADDARFRFTGFQAIHDNDGWITDPFDDDDQHYTAGARFDAFFEGSLVNELGELLPFTYRFDEPEYAAGLGVTLLVFTQRDVDIEDPPRDERPHAGALLFSAYVQRSDDVTMDHIELDLGVVGPSSLAEEIQNSLHDSDGWDKQLHDEFVFNLTVRKTWKLGLAGTKTGRHGVEGWGIEALPQIGGTLGTVYRQAHAQLTLRAGYNMPGDFGPRRVQEFGSARGSSTVGWGGYVFVRALGRGVAHNIFLDGNNYRSSRSVEKENLVAEGAFGFAVTYGSRFEAGWSWTAVSDEYELDDSNDSFATIYFALRF